MKSHQRINADSGCDEYYTPQPIVEAARVTMGRIDLDPASSKTANALVKAVVFFTSHDDGIKHQWHGRVWMNHPFGLRTNGLWVNKLLTEWHALRTKEACCITYASTSEAWFRPLLVFPQCFLHGRTNYYLPDGTLKKGATKGSVVTYLGDNLDKFTENFSKLGTVKIAHYV